MSPEGLTVSLVLSVLANRCAHVKQCGPMRISTWAATLVLFVATMSAGSHLQAASIVGSYYFINPVATGVFVFLSDGRFMGIEDNDPAINPSGQDGLEKGTYTWDSVTGALSINATAQSEWRVGAVLRADQLNCVLRSARSYLDGDRHGRHD